MRDGDHNGGRSTHSAHLVEEKLSGSFSMNGAFLEDATVVSCGHSFGGQLLRKVLETEVKESRCNLCSAEIDTSSLIPNYALRAAAAAVKHEDDRRLFHNAALRKRRKEMGDQMHMVKRQNR
ncbi:unnamed protein product [Camellia sinensis]